MQCYSDHKITNVKLLEMVYAGFGSANHWTGFRKNKTKEKIAQRIKWSGKEAYHS